ncbi:acyl-CoA thioester hydrolase/BAAT C-terminal domain-containing protein [Actinosynnema sp. NPDC047251]|uniref:BAAT/acyl-CoA thioester hydrolase n=1 Tax=Saccharothrix espanaensis (strain ATCC 51144 / DSM 44229 / JCM 9112 / NBRC 15066 / NRRL 15764) TaxID=1179773 RepID=K0KCW9_SACES|nr:acyl-CoA thioesterase/bile acid-CoA:amino acid N-acyltransferase family protein [Saccharothrix espanaensis]CCH34594.1 BAAT/acyl-CoA thioester hydrolase [Saccharothrix espanaensis DSM 44229]
MAEILVSPRRAPLDRPLDIRITDLPPDTEVTVRVSTGDHGSEAVFRSDERGVVDLTRHTPLQGGYRAVDPMGLFWSMSPTGAAPHPTRVEADPAPPVEIERLRVPDDVTRTELPDLSAVLFEARTPPVTPPVTPQVTPQVTPPATPAKRPAVIVLGGSEGGRHELDAALLAGHGFTTLALAYFGAENVPDDLVHVPVEHVGKAIAFLAGRTDKIGILGGSRGGELALLAAATHPEVGAVVSVVGSGVLTQCIGPGTRLLQKLDHEAASWTWQGRPLPYLPYYLPEELRRQVVAGEPVALRAAFDLSDGIPEAAEIPVERIAGGVLLLSSGRDGSWPSAELSEVAERRLALHRHPFRHEHVVYPEAGHLIAGPPHRPATLSVLPGPGVRFDLGGTPSATAAARADAWRRTIEFLSDQLGT